MFFYTLIVVRCMIEEMIGSCTYIIQVTNLHPHQFASGRPDMIMNESKDGCAWGEVLSSTQCTELACTTALQLSVMARLRLRRFEAASIQVQSESGRRSDQLGHNIWRRYATGRRWRPRMEPGTAGRSSSRYYDIHNNILWVFSYALIAWGLFIV